MTKNKTLASLAAATLLAVAANAAHANLLTNGDFQTGALGPATTTYTLDSTMYPESTWNIVSYDTIHGSWVDYYDHTYGDQRGQYMIVNGSTSSSGYAYRQVVEGVSPNTDYDLSGWFASLYPQAVASIDFRVFDVTHETYIATYSFVAPSELATWEERGFTFNSGDADRLAVEIWDTNLAASGNDYSIDDLSLAPTPAIPEPASVAAMAPAALLLARRRR